MQTKKYRYPGACLALGLVATAVFANDELTVEKVTDSVYAVVGEIGNRSPTNYGNNATFGVILTSDGVVLVDPGGTHEGARRIHEKIKTITDDPIVVVINTGGQDHRWLGNGYFRELGAQIVASANAVEDQKSRSTAQYNMLTMLVGEDGVKGTDYVYADRTFEKELTLQVGTTPLEIRHAGPAHTPGDSFVWLPAERILFSGDIVYVERMLGVTQESSSKSWLTVFETMASYQPVIIVPGHGSPTTLDIAKKDTYDYLEFLRKAVGAFMDNGGDISDISAIDQERYRYLANFDELAGRNAQRVFTELEWE